MERRHLLVAGIVGILLVALLLNQPWAEGPAGPMDAGARADADPPAAVDAGPATPAVSPKTATAYRRAVRVELRRLHPRLENCLYSARKRLEVAPEDALVLKLSFTSSPSGSDRGIPRLDKLTSIPKVLQDWLSEGRAKGEAEPAWNPGPDLLPPDCLGAILSAMKLSQPPEAGINLAWSLPSLSQLEARRAAAPSP